jgi:hypothetical protein
MKGGFSWFLLGAIAGAVLVFWYDHKETISAIYNNRGVNDKGVEAAQAGSTLITDLQSIYSSATASK